MGKTFDRSLLIKPGKPVCCRTPRLAKNCERKEYQLSTQYFDAGLREMISITCSFCLCCRRVVSNAKSKSFFRPSECENDPTCRLLPFRPSGLPIRYSFALESIPESSAATNSPAVRHSALTDTRPTVVAGTRADTPLLRICWAGGEGIARAKKSRNERGGNFRPAARLPTFPQARPCRCVRLACSHRGGATVDGGSSGGTGLLAYTNSILPRGVYGA